MLAFRAGGSRYANRFCKISAKQIFLRCRKVSDLGVRRKSRRPFEFHLRLVKVIEHRKQITSFVVQPRRVGKMLQTEFDHSKTLRILLMSQECIGNKQIRLFIFRCEGRCFLQRFECLARLTLARVRLCEQILNARVLTPLLTQPAQKRNRLFKLSSGDVAKREIEFRSVFIRNTPLRFEEMRNRLRKMAAPG